MSSNRTRRISSNSTGIEMTKLGQLKKLTPPPTRQLHMIYKR